ncbi:hypothetical protein F0U59_09345 [Archangium gephyra]|nr:hypothetical protein F0U59_09345 [Archangium gephyra]
MSSTATRLTLYALISAIETDLRAHVGLNLGSVDVKTAVGTDIFNKAVERLRIEEGSSAKADLVRVLPYTDFGELIQILNGNRASLSDVVAKRMRELTPRLEKLIGIRNRVMHTRPLDFEDLPSVLDVSEQLAQDKIMRWPEVELVRNKLSENPSYVLGLSIPVEPDPDSHNLPIPDFDETGFLGREQQVKDLMRLCAGPYPVVSIIGDGGLGKTALALKVAYELLDGSENQFDAIVWTSSKTMQLTAGEIKRIEGAITTSLGVFDRAAHQLAGDGVKDATAEILQYMSEFRILLVLDNLETVLDERIRSFLGNLPSGSKILITSRIGLGEFEYRYKLQGMGSGEAANLLRALAKIRGVSDLVKISNDKLIKFCGQMGNNPGWIKWFVSAVQAGRRPEEALANPALFLQFCMSNVYEYLANDSRRVLQSMQCVPGARSQAELLYLNDMGVLELQKAIQQLLRSNMVTMSSIVAGSSFESRYELSEMARDYLRSHHPVKDKGVYNRFTKRFRELVQTGEEMAAYQTADPYSERNLTMRSQSDRIVAKFLSDAMRARQIDVDGALRLVERALALAPEYFEVRRVEAFVKVAQGDYGGAQQAYEAAVDLEPKSAPLRFWYGGFLLRYLSDAESALVQLREAELLDPASPEIQLEIARASLNLRRFDAVWKALVAIKAVVKLSVWQKKRAADLEIKFYMRRAEHNLDVRDNKAALEDLLGLKGAYESISSELLDVKMKQQIGYALASAERCYSNLQDAVLRAKAGEVLHWAGRVSGMATSLGVERETGVVVRVFRDFAFVEKGVGKEVFLHKSRMRDRGEWGLVKVGTRLEFAVVPGPKGLTALDAVIMVPLN